MTEWVTAVAGLLGVAFVTCVSLTKMRLLQRREEAEEWKHIALTREGWRPAGAAACYHPHPVAVESVVPGVGVVAWWCPSCDVHGPDRESLGWTPAPRPPVGPGAVATGVASVSLQGIAVTYQQERQAADTRRAALDQRLSYIDARYYADQHQAEAGCEASVITNLSGEVLRTVCTCDQGGER